MIQCVGSCAQRVRKSPHLELVPFTRSRQRSVAIELLRLGVQRRALLDHSEASDLQGLASLLAGLDPWGLLGEGAPLLADNLAALVLVQVLGSQATDGLRLAATQHHDLLSDPSQSCSRTSSSWPSSPSWPSWQPSSSSPSSPSWPSWQTSSSSLSLLSWPSWQPSSSSPSSLSWPSWLPSSSSPSSLPSWPSLPPSSSSPC